LNSWHEVDQLISILRTWGISYLVGLDHTINPANAEMDQISPVALIQRLAQCDEYPRVRDASISLLLLHPELSDAVLEALNSSEPVVAERIAVLTLATLYLQRLWSIRLTMAFGHPRAFLSNALSFYGAVVTCRLRPAIMANGACKHYRSSSNNVQTFPLPS